MQKIVLMKKRETYYVSLFGFLYMILFSSSNSILYVLHIYKIFFDFHIIFSFYL